MTEILYSNTFEYKEFLQLNHIDFEDFKRECVVLSLVGQPIGIAWHSYNYVHPYADYLNIFIVKDHRNKGYGKLLFQASLKLSMKKRIQVSFDFDEKLIAFYEALNFKKVKTTSLPVIDSNQIKTTDNNLKISNFKWNYLTESLLFKHYYENHLNNPVNVDLAYNDYFKYMLSDFSKKYSYMYRHKEQIIYLIAFKGEADNTIEIGYFGYSTNIDQETINDFVNQTLNKLSKEFRTISFEVDDTDIYGKKLIEILGIDLKPDWLTYQYLI